MKQLENKKWLIGPIRLMGLIGLMLLVPMLMQAQQLREKTDYDRFVEAVDEYVPAPGQFINTMPEYVEGDTPETMAAKCTTILRANSTDDVDNQGLICLGAYGGYITFHFDHSVANIEGNDLRIIGNAFSEAGSSVSGSSEPGIIMVSKDVNRNWLPDDPWYELTGSADVDSVGKVIYNYEITYLRCPMEATPWTDNQGQEGTVARNGFHKQEYYPLWIDAESLTFSGTLLPKSGMSSTSGFVQQFYREGYVDNRPDDVTFDISRAVDADRQPVQLDFIDFVRVYNATNQQYPMVGETSTEIRIAEDLHLEASLDAIEQAASGITDLRVSSTTLPCYDLTGRSVTPSQRGIYIINGKKIFIK